MALRSRNAHYDLHGIQTRRWQDLARKAGGAPLWDAMQILVERVPAALAAVEARLPGDFPPRTWDKISGGLKAQAERFKTGLSADD